MTPRLVILAGCALALAGCNTTTTAKVDGSATTPVTVQTKLDTKIAAVSEQLAKSCAYLSVGLTLAKTFNKYPSVAPYIDAAKVAQEDFCANPPSDTQTAIQVVGRIAADLANAVAEAK